MMACCLVVDLSVSGKWHWGNSWVLSKVSGWSRRSEIGLTPEPGCGRVLFNGFSVI